MISVIDTVTQNKEKNPLIEEIKISWLSISFMSLFEVFFKFWSCKDTPECDEINLQQNPETGNDQLYIKRT